MAATSPETTLPVPHPRASPRVAVYTTTYGALIDHRLLTDLVRILRRCGQAARAGVRVSVRDAEVTLRGTVPDGATRERCGHLAGLVDGVKRVHNQLELRPAAVAP